MNRSRQSLWQHGFRPLWILGLLFRGLGAAHAQTLFDANLGTLPEQQGWSYLAVGSAVEAATNAAVLLNTSSAASTHAGWAELAPPLNRTNGFALVFGVQINAEMHNNPNRAGFSVIVLGEDARGIELGFWQDTVFAQADSPLFTHGEDARFATTNAVVDYALTMFATNYVLSAGGTPLLSGPVRDYTSFTGFPNPYTNPNFLFFGDDTGSAAASVLVRRVSLIRPPVLRMLSPAVISWTGVSNQTYTVEGSSNLTTWAPLESVLSAGELLQFTNNPTGPNRYFRVVFP